jgi:hypothetical protein
MSGNTGLWARDEGLERRKEKDEVRSRGRGLESECGYGYGLQKCTKIGLCKEVVPVCATPAAVACTSSRTAFQVAPKFWWLWCTGGLQDHPLHHTAPLAGTREGNMVVRTR